MGAYARSVVTDEGFPRYATTYSEIRGRLLGAGASREDILALCIAWLNFENAQRAARAKPKARKPDSPTSVRPGLRFQIMQRDAFKCQLCGATAQDARLEVDHKFPRARGGKDIPANLWTLCLPCNRGKGASLLE